VPLAALLNELHREIEIASDSAAFSSVAQELLERRAADLVSSLPLWPSHLDDERAPLVKAESERRFGRPPWVLARGEGFRMQLQLVPDETAVVHVDDGPGALLVLAGGRLLARHKFLPMSEVDDGLGIGRIELEDLSLIPAGHSVAFATDASAPHRLLPVTPPSLALVVRSVRGSICNPRATYAPPSIRFDPHAAPPGLEHHMALSELDVFCSSDYRRLMRAFAERAGGLALLRMAMRLFAVGQDGPLEELLRFVALGRPTLAREIAAALTERRRELAVLTRRRQASGSGAVLLLSMLALTADRGAIARAVARTCPGRPVQDTMSIWLGELFGADRSRNPASAPGADELACMGCAFVARDDDELWRLLEDAFTPEATSNRAEIETLLATLRGSLVLGPLFRAG
jgi:hypothetical protein